MADTVAIKVEANIVDLVTKFTLAKAQSQQLTAELNKLAREAVNAGGATPALNSQLQQIATQSLQAKSRLAELSSQMKTGTESARGNAEAFGAVQEAMAAFGLALSVDKVVEFGKSVFDSAEQVYHQAEVLQMSTDAYQAFSVSAQRAGVEVDTVDGALRKFNASQGQAQTGTGAAAKAFNDLGVSAKLPSAEALPALARALLAIEDPARRSRDEVALFGRSGEELNPALEEWAQGVNKLTAQLSAMGLIQSNEVLKGAHDAKVAMDTAWLKAETSWGKPVIAVSHIIQGLGDILASIPDLAHKAQAAMVEYGAAEAGITDPQQLKWMTEGYSEPAKPYRIPGSGSGGTKAGAPKPNWTDKADAEKAANQARQIADETAKAYEQGNQRHIESEAQTNSYLLSMGEETLDQWKTQAVQLEDDRYNTALEGIKKREAADANDKVKEAADQAAEAQLYQEHADKLTAIDQQYNEKKKQQEQAALQDFIAQQDQQLQTALAKLDQEYQHQQITAQQKHDAEVQLTQQIEQEVLSRLDTEIAGLTQGTTAYENAMKQRAEIVQKYNKQIQEENQQLNQSQAQQWDQANRTILQSEQSFITGFLSGRETLGASMLQMFSSFLEKEIAQDIAYWTERELLAIEGVGKEKITEQEGFLERLADMVFFNSSSDASAVTGAAAAKASAAAEIPAYTGIAAMGAASAVAAIPIVGPELAMAAFAEMEGLGATAGGTASLDTGTNFVPSDMMAMIHAGERVIPAADNSDIMSALNGGGGSGSGGMGVSVGNITLQNVNGDPQQTARNFIQAVAVEIRNGNTTLKQAVNG